jgi:uncharacterized membrane protein
MTWLQRYHLRGFIKSSLWLYPVVGLLAALMVAPVIRWLDRITLWSWLNFSPDGARAILGAFAASMLTFLVFVLSAMIIVVQLASAQLTPRIIGPVFSKRQVKTVLGIFTFSYIYTLAALGRVEQTVPQLPVALAVVLNLLSIVVFVRFVYQIGVGLRPIAILEDVGMEGRRIVESVYPRLFNPAHETSPPSGPRRPSPTRTIDHTGASGTVLAFSPADMVAIARRSDSIIALVPQVGDFIAKGDPFFRVLSEPRPVDDEAMRQCVAIGPERTMEQDPRFAFRIMVDIANKALSPAINDPTTAVLALDQIHRLLLYVGHRDLDSGEGRDADGKLRLVYGTPDWPDYVLLAVSEIRHYGKGSIQVARRLRAMLEHLIRVLPEGRRAPLRRELQLLQKSVERDFDDQMDRDMAEVSDNQGVGGSAHPE